MSDDIDRLAAAADATVTEMQRLRAEVASLARERDEAQELANDLNDGCVAYEKTITRLQGALEAVLRLVSTRSERWVRDIVDVIDAALAAASPVEPSRPKESVSRAPQGENARTTCRPWCGEYVENSYRAYCTNACMDARKPLTPPGPSSRRPAREVAHEILGLLRGEDGWDFACYHDGLHIPFCDKVTAIADRLTRAPTPPADVLVDALEQLADRAGYSTTDLGMAADVGRIARAALAAYRAPTPLDTAAKETP